MGRRPVAEDNYVENIAPGTQDVNLKKGDMSLMRMLPIAAGLALVLASATAYAQTTPAAGCMASQKAGEGGNEAGSNSAQKAGEGGNEAGSIAAQKAGEGGGANSAGSNVAQKFNAQKAGEGGNEAGSVSAQKAGEGGNEAGSLSAQKAGEGDGANAAGSNKLAQKAGAATTPCKG